VLPRGHVEHVDRPFPPLSEDLWREHSRHGETSTVGSCLIDEHTAEGGLPGAAFAGDHVHGTVRGTGAHGMRPGNTTCSPSTVATLTGTP